MDFLLHAFETWRDAPAMVWRGQSFSYAWLSEQLETWAATIAEHGVTPGTVVVLEADYSPRSVALFLALVRHGCIAIPLTPSVEPHKPAFRAIAHPQATFRFDDADDDVVFERHDPTESHPHYEVLRSRGHGGLVVFSSGSTGSHKGIVHDMVALLAKYERPRHRRRAVVFLQYDHLGGVNTLLYILANGGCAVTVQDRRPDEVLRLVEDHRVDLLPTSPTFLNLMLVSGAHERHDLSSLKLITYGTEPMPSTTLERLGEALPGVELLQTYGLSELGVLRSKSRSRDSLWVKVGGEGFETRVVDGVLHIRAASAMIGYLNAPDPFTEDGWYITGDEVEVDGDYVRFVGRQSDIINVGGEKVFPAEVEAVLLAMPEVADATVFGGPHPLTGQVVCARVVPVDPSIERRALTRAVRSFCRERLQRYKVPVKVELAEQAVHSPRFKKTRGTP